MGVYAWMDYVIYLCILAVILFVLYKLFQKIRFDERLIVSVLPYILIGTFIRVLADLKVFPWSQWWSVTPGVYVVTIIMALFFISLGLVYQRISGRRYHEVPFIAGLIMAGILFYWVTPFIKDYSLMLYALALALSIALAVYALSVPTKIRIFQSRFNIGILFAHMLDASSTFIAYDYFGFYEEHLLPIYAISLAGTAFIMIPIKLILVGLCIYFLEKWYREEKKDKNNETVYLMTKFLLLIIGIGPGLRNTMLPALNL